MMQSVIWLALICCFGCSGAAADHAQVMKDLKLQAQAVVEAMIHDNHETLVRYTLPALVEEMGGRDEMIKALTETSLKHKKHGFAITAVLFAAEQSIVNDSANYFAIVPFELEATMPGGRHVTQPSFLIGFSKDVGRNWQFADGSGFEKDPARLKTLLPGFPDSLPLPAAKPPIVHDR
jgi:hypothetical protein